MFSKRAFRSSRQYSRLVALALLAAAASGCASIEAVPPDPNLGPANAAHVTVYRPSSDWMGAAVEYRAYADKVILGVVARGGAIGGFVKPGPATIRVQAHFLGFPDGWPVKLELDLRAGERYFLRFTQYLDSVVPLPTGAIVTGGLQLRKVSEAIYTNRE